MFAALALAAAMTVIQVPKEGWSGTPQATTKLVHAAFEVTIPAGWRTALGPYGADGIGIPTALGAEKGGKKGGDAVVTILAVKSGALPTDPKAKTRSWGKTTWTVIQPEKKDGHRTTWSYLVRGKKQDYMASGEIGAADLKAEADALMASFVLRDKIGG